MTIGLVLGLTVVLAPHASAQDTISEAVDATLGTAPVVGVDISTPESTASDALSTAIAACDSVVEDVESEPRPDTCSEAIARCDSLLTSDPGAYICSEALARVQNLCPNLTCGGPELLIELVAEITADDCPEGNVSSLSLLCASRDNPAAFMPSPALRSDHMAPTANYKGPCEDTVPNTSDPFCQTDNRELWVFRESTMGTVGNEAIAWTLDNSYHTTKLNVHYASPASYTGSAETDIIYRTKATDTPGMLLGTTWCDDSVSSTRCDQHYVSFEHADLDVTTTERRQIACHETGHAVGLVHGSDAAPAISDTDSRLACMGNPSSSQYLGTANADAINSTYN